MNAIRITALKRQIETNEQRAAATDLKQAPVMQGYFFKWKDCIENLADNIARAAKGEPPRFRQMFIETIDACNLKCPCCYLAARGVDGAARLGINEMKNVVNAGKDAGVGVVAVAGRGEPLMDPNFWQLAHYVRECGLQFLVFTNGTMVTNEVAKRLKEVCTTVVTKIFALTPDGHDVLVGVRGEYVKTRAVLVALLEAGMRAPNLGIDLVIAKQNQGDLEQLLRLCRMFGVVPYFERMARIGRAKALNGNIVLPDGEVDTIFGRLRTIDETEFGVTWGVVPGMAALANAETDKRMVALHVNTFGDVQPGLETGRIIGNFRDNENGIRAILRDAKAWGAYYAEIAEELGLDMGMDEADRKNQTANRLHHTGNTVALPALAEIQKPKTYIEKLAYAAEQVGIFHRQHAEKCEEANAKQPTPEAIARLVDAVGTKITGTEYEKPFLLIRELALDENIYCRTAGKMLLIELVYGRRHMQLCEQRDLDYREWEGYDVDEHLAKDNIWRLFGGRNGIGIIEQDITDACQPFNHMLLRLFLENELEYAALSQILNAMVPDEQRDPEGNVKAAKEMDETLKIAHDKELPIFWNLAYEAILGRKGMPRNNRMLEIVRKHAVHELEWINRGLREAGEPIDWLRQHTCCIFVGANDLASLAGWLYYDAKDVGDAKMQAIAGETIQLLAKNQTIRQKLMRKNGIPREVL